MDTGLASNTLSEGLLRLYAEDLVNRTVNAEEEDQNLNIKSTRSKLDAETGTKIVGVKVDMDKLRSYWID